MAASKFLAGCLASTAALCLTAQFASATAGAMPPPTSRQASSAGSSPSPGQHAGHRTQVQVEDDSQPTELTQAEAAIDKKDYAAAETLLHKFLAHDASSYVAWFDLGFVENALDKVDDSIAAYRKSVAANPGVFESNLNLGLQLAKTGAPDAAQFLRAATGLKPTSRVAEGQYRAWLSLAQVLAKGQPDEALSAYQHAATLEPQEAEPHLSAGLLLEQQNKFTDAEQEYKQALVIDPRSSDAVLGLANIYMRGRRFPEAEDYLRKLLTQHPNSAAIHIQLGRVLAAENKADAAIVELQAGTKLAPGDVTAERDLADLYLSVGKNDLAEATYRALLAAHPNDAELHHGLGKALLFQKKSQAAQRELAATVSLDPKLGDAYYDLAFAANDNKEYPTVIRALDARAKLLPETPMTYFLRASAYDHLRDFKNAAANYRLFLNHAAEKYPDQEWQAKHRLITIDPKK
ncbi:MAG: tetratricopeptide repeat protein [Candidatus Sulfotelmatobacter sp.]